MVRYVALAAVLAIGLVTAPGAARAQSFGYEPWPAQGPQPMLYGDAHGDVAVTASGEVLLSIQDAAKPGVHVYSAKGVFQRVIPNTPDDFHGFVLHRASDGQEYIYGAGLNTETIYKIGLDGRVALRIAAETAIPERFHAEYEGKKYLGLSGIAVGPNDDIYVVDGYGRDYIHRFDPEGRYLQTFAGREPPYNFENCHKIALDPRFSPARLICSDRLHNRIVHLSLSGEMLGVVAEDLRRPSAMAFHGDLVAVAEIEGRVTVLDKAGKAVATLGTNDVKSETNTNETKPEAWRAGVFTSPHGIAFTADGDLLVTEWNKFGRVVRYARQD